MKVFLIKRFKLFIKCLINIHIFKNIFLLFVLSIFHNVLNILPKTIKIDIETNILIVKITSKNNSMLYKFWVYVNYRLSN